MRFNNFLGAYYRDTGYGGDRLFADMLAQARLVERLGFRGVTIPEHHLINILLIPDPLQFAVKVASITEHLEIVTSVCQLPLHDMRIFAGQVIQAGILCEGRLVLGVGRGAFAYELARMGKPIDESRERFDESLNVLLALLAREEVSWDGKYYQFAPITVMPRPGALGSPPIMIAALRSRGNRGLGTPRISHPDDAAQCERRQDARASRGVQARQGRVRQGRPRSSPGPDAHVLCR